MLGLLGCPSEDADPQDQGESGEGGGGGTGGIAGSGGTGGSGGSGGTGGSSGSGGGSEPTGDAAACASAVPTFTSATEVESIQWDAGNGEEKVAADTVNTAVNYFLPERGAFTLAANGASGSIVLALDGLGSVTSAGTYRCADGFSVVVSGVGSANMFGADAGADCAITLTTDITEGGRIEATFWALLAGDAGSPGDCVHGRLGITDI